MWIRAVKCKEIVFNLLGLLFIALFLLFPAPCIHAAKDGLNISLYMVLPALFPFMVISAYLRVSLPLPRPLKTGIARLTGLSENAASPFILGLISGFPVGAVLCARAVKDKQLTLDEANHLFPLNTVCGPLFAIGVAGGGMLGSFQLGYLIYGVQIVSLLLLCLLQRKNAPRVSKNTQMPPIKITFTAAVEQSMQNILFVVGFVMFFNVVCEMVHQIGLFENLCPIPSVLYGGLELSCGINRVALSDLSLHLKFSFTCALCAFSGICVFLQAANAVRGARLSMAHFVRTKLLHALLAFGIAYLVFPLFRIQTFSFTQAVSFSLSPVFYVTTQFFLLFGCTLLTKGRKL